MGILVTLLYQDDPANPIREPVLEYDASGDGIPSVGEMVELTFSNTRTMAVVEGKIWHVVKGVEGIAVDVFLKRAMPIKVAGKFPTWEDDDG